jgi:hypothetical protein
MTAAVVVACFVMQVRLTAPHASAELLLTGVAPPTGPLNADFAAVNDGGTVVFRGGSGPDIVTWLRYADGTYEQAAVPSGFTSVVLGRINDSGASVGSVFGGSASSTRAVIRRPDGSYTFPLPGSQSTAVAINDAGNVVGVDSSASPARPYLWRASGGVTYVPPPPGAASGALNRAVGVNNNDAVAAMTGVAPPTPQPGILFNRAFRYTPAGGSVLLPTVGSDPTEAADINDAGVIVGTVGGFGSAVRAARWAPDGTIMELLPPSSSGFITAQGINSGGDVVGSGLTLGVRALLWSSDFGNIDLNDLLTPAQRFNWELRIAFDINDRRQVVGSGRFDPDGPGGPQPPANQLFLLDLVPVPEPTGGLIVLAALPTLFRTRRRRA